MNNLKLSNFRKLNDLVNDYNNLKNNVSSLHDTSFIKEDKESIDDDMDFLKSEIYPMKKRLKPTDYYYKTEKEYLDGKEKELQLLYEFKKINDKTQKLVTDRLARLSLNRVSKLNPDTQSHILSYLAPDSDKPLNMDGPPPVFDFEKNFSRVRQRLREHERKEIAKKNNQQQSSLSDSARKGGTKHKKNKLKRRLNTRKK